MDISEPQTTCPAPSPDDILREKFLRRIPRGILLSAALLGLVTAFLFDLLTALVFLFGGVLSASSFIWLKKSLRRFLGRDRTKALRSGFLLYLSRLILICAAFFFIIVLFPRKILAFAAGFSLLVPVFLIEGAGALFRMKTWKN